MQQSSPKREGGATPYHRRELLNPGYRLGVRRVGSDGRGHTKHGNRHTHDTDDGTGVICVLI